MSLALSCALFTDSAIVTAFRPSLRSGVDLKLARDAVFSKRAQGNRILTNNLARDEVVENHQKLLLKARNIEARATNNTVALQDYYPEGADVAYLASIGIGTPAVDNLLQIDTGSGDTWTTYSKIVTSGQTGYDPSQSSTANITQYMFNDTYGTGDAEGQVVGDVYSLGSFNIKSYFGVITQPDTANENSPLAGIIPFGTSQLSSIGVPTPFEYLMSNNLVSESYFSLYLARGRDSNPTSNLVSGSQLCLGCIVSLPSGISTSGSLAYVPVTQLIWWTVAMDGISYNGKVVASTNVGSAVIDSGTSFLYVPTSAAQAFATAIGATLQDGGYMTIPVGSISGSTSIGLSFGGTVYNINPEDLVVQYADKSKTTYILAIMAQDMPDQNGNPSATIGDTFLKNVISVFSYSNNGAPAVGFQQISSSSNSSISVASGSVTGLPGATHTTVATSQHLGGATTTNAFGSSTASSKSGALEAANVSLRKVISAVAAIGLVVTIIA